ncbi:tRNA threonylcarbamoyladenosine biosynthesis protein TsaB [Alphaproteobacteria bacterium SO-S41]|nr:tRNA threonylcarbamoyladenosine biosynthesis protein TsaB [Alphaproteobacteria bacterium SO-S41]
MICLGLDTALGACSAALADETGLIARRFEPMAIGHAEAVAPMTEALLKEAGLTFVDLGRIAVTTGPGTFTGQRIGLAFARGLALALKIPCAGVTTLEAIAAAARAEHPGRPVLVTSDAKRGEAYVQAFGADCVALNEPALVTYEAATEMARTLGDDAVLAGTASALLNLPGLTVAAADQPDAAVVARLGLAQPVPDHPPHPLYLRAPDAKVAGPLKAPPPQRRDRT